MSAREITARVNQITFSQPMLRDLEMIETVRRPNSALVPSLHSGPTPGSRAIAFT